MPVGNRICDLSNGVVVKNGELRLCLLIFEAPNSDCLSVRHYSTLNISETVQVTDSYNATYTRPTLGVISNELE